MDFISLPISIISLLVSVGTFWLAFLRRGQLKMTKPTLVFFGFDFTPNPTAKVFIRTLLYSTAVRGCIIEGMYARVTNSYSTKNFSFWGYGEGKKLTAGSGLYVSREGFSGYHHFVFPAHESEYFFHGGQYDIEIFAIVVGQKKPRCLSTIKIDLSKTLASDLGNHDGVLFERVIDGGYVGHSQQKSF